MKFFKVKKPLLKSCVCTQAQWDTEWLPRWSIRMKESPKVVHRKLWEWCFIAQALHERGMLQEGRRGVGFAVGKEPLSGLFASCGCDLLATDLDYEQSHEKGWVDSNQHANALADLNERGLCDPSKFQKLVSFRNADMNNIPDDLRGFDFLWSCCAIEHLGSIPKGMEFVYKAMDCLKPGGIAVHTTDFNVSSNNDTLDYHTDVLFRKQDMEEISRFVAAKGHRMAPLDLETGLGPADQAISEPPYIQDAIHLKLKVGSYVVTSIGLIIQKRSALRDMWERLKAFIDRAIS